MGEACGAQTEAPAEAMVCRGEMMVVRQVLRTRRGVLRDGSRLPWGLEGEAAVVVEMKKGE